MENLRIHPPLVVKDTPRPRRLASIAEAQAFVKDGMRLGRPPAWREIYYRLAAVRNEDEAVEAVGALRELFELEDLLLPPELPIESRHDEED